MKKQFLISVSVKPYVKRFIEVRFGNPANFTHDSAEYALVQKSLSDPRTKYESKLEHRMATYSYMFKPESYQSWKRKIN